MKISLRTALILCSVLAGTEAPSPALDFTLRHGNMSADGANIASTYITDGENKIFVRIQRDWKVADNPGALELIPEFTGSKVRIENVGGARVLPLDESGKTLLRKQVDAEVPGGAKNVVALPDQDNPLPIFGWKDAEITRSYEFYGQTIYHSSLYVNMLPGRVVRVSITAAKADYEKVHDAVRLLLFSWFEPSKDLPPDVQRKMAEGTLGGS